MADEAQTWSGKGIDAAAIAISTVPGKPYVDDLAAGRTVPILQDESAAGVVNHYGMAQDDLVLLDRRGYVWKQVRTGDGTDAIDMTDPTDIATLESWLLQIPH